MSKKITFILSILLLFSLSSNFYLISNKIKNPNEIIALNQRGFIMSIGSLNEVMNRLSQANWEDPVLLSTATSLSNEAQIYAKELAALTNYVNRQSAERIAESRIGYVQFYLRDIIYVLDQDFGKSIKGNSFDKQQLEKIRDYLNYASYPNQSNFSWESFSKSNNRLLENVLK